MISRFTKWIACVETCVRTESCSRCMFGQTSLRMNRFQALHRMSDSRRTTYCSPVVVSIFSPAYLKYRTLSPAFTCDRHLMALRMRDMSNGGDSCLGLLDRTVVFAFSRTCSDDRSTQRPFFSTLWQHNAARCHITDSINLNSHLANCRISSFSRTLINTRSPIGFNFGTSSADGSSIT